jgi:hypothetical protein
VAAFVLSVLTSSSPATAQVYGQFTGAETVPLGGRLFGAYAFTSENVLALLAQLRLSFYPNVDFGFNGGIARQDFGGGHRTTLRLGTGLKVKLADSTAQVPMALAFAADLGIETGDDFHVLTVVPSVIGSRTFKFGQNSTVTPYGRAGIAISQIDVANNEDTDVAIPLRLGADFGVAPGLRLAAELQINLSDAFNDNIGFGAGVNLPF